MDSTARSRELAVCGAEQAHRRHLCNVGSCSLVGIVNASEVSRNELTTGSLRGKCMAKEGFNLLDIDNNKKLFEE